MESPSAFLDGIRSDDPSAWNSFHLLMHRLLQTVIRKFRIQTADREDILQEVMIRVFRRVQMFDHSRPGAFRAWLCTIARHEAINVLRLKQRLPRAAGGSANAHFWRQCADLAELSGVESVAHRGDSVNSPVPALDSARSHLQLQASQRDIQVYTLAKRRWPAADIVEEMRERGYALTEDNVYQIKSRVARQLRRWIQSGDLLKRDAQAVTSGNDSVRPGR